MAWDTSVIDPGEDFIIFDGVEDVSYQHFNPTTDTWGTAYTLHGVLFRATSESIAGINKGETTVQAARVHVKATEFTEEAARRDRLIRADGSVYIVQTANDQSLGTRILLEVTLSL